MKRVLKICANTWDSASRDKRELTLCRDLGAETLVMAKGAPGDSFREEEVSGFKVYRFSTRPLGTARWLTPLNQILSLFVWGRKARKFRPDVITGHDLPGLFVGYLSNFGNPHKAALVYDSHEFEIGRAVRRSRLHIWLVTRLERFLMKRCAFSIMVNDSIAGEVQRIHRLKERPVVARNVPSYWELDPAEAARVRSGLLEKLGLPEGTFLTMYHGALMPERGIENLLRAVSLTPGTAAVVLGNGNESYVSSLRALCRELGAADRVLFHPAVPVEALRNYAGAADMGVSLLQPVVQNHILALPNKFFENIQSLTPVIVSDFPAISSLLRHYGIGLPVNPESPEDIAAAIRRMRDDREFYAACKENLKRAKEELCWEREKTALEEAYRRILS